LSALGWMQAFLLAVRRLSALGWMQAFLFAVRRLCGESAGCVVSPQPAQDGLPAQDGWWLRTGCWLRTAAGSGRLLAQVGLAECENPLTYSAMVERRVCE